MKRSVLGGLVVGMLVLLSGAAVLPSPRGPAPHATFLPSPRVPRQIVPLSDTAYPMFIGDSLTAGTGTWQPARDAFPVRWTDRACGQSVSCRNRVLRSGIGGSCLVVTCGATPALTELWESVVLSAVPRPTTVIVEIGVNDLFEGITLDQYAVAYTYLMTSGSAAGIRVLLMTIPPTTIEWPWHTEHNPLRQSVNGWLRSHFGMPHLIDIDAGLRVGTSGDADPCFYYINGAGDGLHPNTLGALSIADWIGIERVT